MGQSNEFGHSQSLCRRISFIASFAPVCCFSSSSGDCETHPNTHTEYREVHPNTDPHPKPPALRQLADEPKNCSTMLRFMNRTTQLCYNTDPELSRRLYPRKPKQGAALQGPFPARTTPQMRNATNKNQVPQLFLKHGRHDSAPRLLATDLPVAGVEIVPLVAGTAPIVVRGPVVGLVVRVLRLLVVEAGGLLVVTSLGVKGRSLLTAQYK